jgi:histidine triad (HIT) family protein
MTDDCIFCKIVAGKAPAAKVYETEAVFAFHDINPVAPTHVLIVPKKHIARLSDLEAEDAALMGEIVYAARVIAEQEGVAGAFRLVANNGRGVGQSIFHVHFHLLGGRTMGWPPG